MQSSRTLIHGDAFSWLKQQEPQSFDCVIADPPDNLGLNYDGFKDRVSPEAYEKFLVDLIKWGALTGRHFWLSYYHKHQPAVMSIVRAMLRENPKLAWRQYVWRFTFGQYTDSDCANGYRPILRLSFMGDPVTTGGIMVPSERALMGDKRASNGGNRVPDDVWEFPRIVGNSHERRSWHPTQHPIGLYQRMIRLSSRVADRVSVVDLFGGTGTVFRATAGLPDMDVTAVEQSLHYCAHIRNEHGIDIERQ